MQGVAEVFGFNLKKSKVIVALVSRDKGMQEVWGSQESERLEGIGKGLLSEKS